MGQQINANLYRVKINNGWNSNWSCDKKNYSFLLHDDLFILKFLRCFLEKRFGLKIGDFCIQRKFGSVDIWLYVYINFYRNLINYNIKNERFPDNSRYLNHNISRILSKITVIEKLLSHLFKCNFKIHLKKSDSPYTSAEYISTGIKYLIEKSYKGKKRALISFFKCLKNEWKAHKKDIKGIRIRCAGRLDGKSRIAAIYKHQCGQVPLQTIKAKINYAISTAFIRYGTIGIKVWVCLNK